jgi:hypothetical protein
MDRANELKKKATEEFNKCYTPENQACMNRAIMGTAFAFLVVLIVLYFLYRAYLWVKKLPSKLVKKSKFEEPEVYQDGEEFEEPEVYQDGEEFENEDFEEPEVYQDGEEFENEDFEEPEPFNNDLPNQNVKLKEEGNYSEESLPLMALDKSVIQQHNKYVTERNKVTSTASFQPSRSDTQDVVPFVGLRRPSYSVNGKDLVDETARSVPTELDADKLAKPTQIYWK